MSMVLSELEMPFALKFLEKGSTSSYPMIIGKVFESKFEYYDADV